MNSVKGVILFIFFSIAFYVVIMFALSKVKYNNASLIVQTNDFYVLKGGDTYAKFHDFKEQELHDIVFVGSSRCYRHYNPGYFAPEKLVSWNLGSSAQTISNSKIVIESLLNKANCRIVVLDVFTSAFFGSSFESSVDLITNVPSSDMAFQIALEMDDSRAMNLLMKRSLELSEPPSFKDEDYVGKGFCAHTDTLAKEIFHQNESDVKDLEITHEQLTPLLEIIDYCKTENIHLIVSISPTSNDFHEKTHVQFLEVLVPVLEKHDVPLFDYAKSLPIESNEHFYDDAHMNLEGVKIFNQVFYEDLKKANFVK